jgi:hypothetical protein
MVSGLPLEKEFYSAMGINVGTVSRRRIYKFIIVNICLLKKEMHLLSHGNTLRNV